MIIQPEEPVETPQGKGTIDNYSDYMQIAWVQVEGYDKPLPFKYQELRGAKDE